MSIQFRRALHQMALSTACVFFAVASFSTAAIARDFRSADVHPGDYPTVAAVKYMGKLLGDQTKGRLGVRVYPAGSLGTEKDNIEQLKIGGLDMMRINVGVLNSVVPETIVTVLPFVFRSTEHMRKVLDGPVGNDILAAMEAQGLVGLAFYDSGSRPFYTAKKTNQDTRRYERPESASATVRPVRRDDRSARCQPHTDAFR